MSFLSRLFSSTDVVEKTVDSAFSALDKSFFTDEEKAEYSQKAQEIYQKMWLAAVPSAISRRIIACSVVLMWCVLLVVMLIAKGMGADAFADYAVKVMEDIVLTPFNIIVGFYFLKQVVGSFNSK